MPLGCELQFIYECSNSTAYSHLLMTHRTAPQILHEITETGLVGVASVACILQGACVFLLTLTATSTIILFLCGLHSQ